MQINFYQKIKKQKQILARNFLNYRISASNKFTN